MSQQGSSDKNTASPPSNDPASTPGESDDVKQSRDIVRAFYTQLLPTPAPRPSDPNATNSDGKAQPKDPPQESTSHKSEESKKESMARDSSAVSNGRRQHSRSWIMYDMKTAAPRAMRRHNLKRKSFVGNDPKRGSIVKRPDRLTLETPTKAPLTNAGCAPIDWSGLALLLDTSPTVLSA